MPKRTDATPRGYNRKVILFFVSRIFIRLLEAVFKIFTVSMETPSQFYLKNFCSTN